MYSKIRDVSWIWLYFNMILIFIFKFNSVNAMSLLRQTTTLKKVNQMFNQLMTALIYLTTVARAYADNGARLWSNVSGRVIHNVPFGVFEMANARLQKPPRPLSRLLLQRPQLFIRLQRPQQLVQLRRPVWTCGASALSPRAEEVL